MTAIEYIGFLNYANNESRYEMTGTRMAVMIPIRPMASPLNAPSTAPSWMAAAVPTPCDEAPRASPLAMRLSIPNTFITAGPTMLPKIPTATTMTAVSEGMPPFFSEIPMAIGVVTDLGCRVAISDWSAPISFPMTITLIIQDRYDVPFQVFHLFEQNVTQSNNRGT